MQERRNTRQRQLVLEDVVGRCDHPTADDVYLDVRAKDEHISRATVYRNLHILAEDGEIRSVRTPDGEHFDRRLDDHAHIICRCCGKVVDAPMTYNSDVDASVAEATGFEVFSHSTLFDGLCPDCRENLSDKSDT